jgi:hypothetical protein
VRRSSPYGEPIVVDRHGEIEDALYSQVVDALNGAERRAWAIVDSQRSPVPIRRLTAFAGEDEAES